MDAKASALETVSTAELTKMIRQASDTLDAAMRVPNCDYFAAHLEVLRSNYFELFRRLMLRNPFSSIRKDVVSKMWFRTIYPPIEQYRANIKQFESMLNWSPSHQPPQSAGGAASDHLNMDPITIRRELSKWRARFQTFLQATSGLLLKLVAELAEVHSIVVAGTMVNLEAFAVNYRALSTHAHGFDFVDCLRTELHPTLSTVQRAALAIVSRLLTYLGDLSRYRILYTSKKQNVAGMVRAITSGEPQYQQQAQTDMWWPAKNFYRGAIKLAPHRGQSQNQLAVIYGYERNTLDGVFCYYRALTSLYRFRPAEANLRTILDNAIRAIRAPVDPTPADSATGGYQYYDTKLYPNFTQLRFVFAIHQPSEKELGRLEKTGEMPTRTQITAEMEQELVGDVGAACTKFMQGVKSGSLDDRQILTAQAIHVFEQQQLSSLNVGDKETQLHDVTVARLSALLTMRIAESLCYALVASVNDGMQRGAGEKSASRAAHRGVPALAVTLAWIVAASARVVRDSACQEYLTESGGTPVSRLKQQVFAAVRDSGLLRNAKRLKDAMDRSPSSRRNQAAPPPPAWSDVLKSSLVLARLMWGGSEPERAEDDLLVGWQLPDGTVWGKPPPECSSQPPAPMTPAKSSSSMSWWWQLHGLLSLVSECVPAVLGISDRGAKGDASAVPAQPCAAASGNNEDEEEGEEENDTICFQGRPRMQSQMSTAAPIPEPVPVSEPEPKPEPKPEPEPPTPATDDSQQSLPATPQMVAADFRSDPLPQAAVPLPSSSPTSPPPPQAQAQQQLRNYTEPLLAQLHLPHGRGWGGVPVQLPAGDAPGEWGRQQAEATRVMMDRMALQPSNDDSAASYEQAVLALIGSELDEFVSPAAASTYRRGLPPRPGAIGSQRAPAGPAMRSIYTAGLSSSGAASDGSASAPGHQWPAFSQSSAPTTAPVSPDIRSLNHHQQPYSMAASILSSPQTTAKNLGPWSTADASPSSSLSSDHAAGANGGWDSLLTHSGHNTLSYNQSQPLQMSAPQQSAAMNAWQQYQLESHRKAALQQQLDQQQKIQMHLQQQLFYQQQQQWYLQQQHMRAAGLDTTAASVLHMALSTPAMDSRPPADIYAAYNMSPRITAALSAAQPPPPLNGSLSNSSSLSAVAASVSYPWAMMATGNNPTTGGNSVAAALSNSSSASNIQSLPLQQTYEWCS
ncbi:hypothetical protein GGI17_000450 [Coemansia sp. S146]|nr:hypothetical protein GGI17_000450 [Coemansia sp. S146]